MADFCSEDFEVWEDPGMGLHHWSGPLNSSFALSWNRLIVKNWSQYLQYWQRYFDIFICHFAASVPLLETDNISLVCRYIIQICPVLMACTWKNRFLLTFMKHLVERKSQVPCGMLFLRLAQKQVQIRRRHFSSIVGFRSPNFAQR